MSLGTSSVSLPARTHGGSPESERIDPSHLSQGMKSSATLSTSCLQFSTVACVNEPSKFQTFKTSFEVTRNKRRSLGLWGESIYEV